MNIVIRRRLWQILWDIDTPWWGSGIYPRPCPNAVYRWWTFGPLHIRRFYFGGEYGGRRAPSTGGTTET